MWEEVRIYKQKKPPNMPTTNLSLKLREINVFTKSSASDLPIRFSIILYQFTTQELESFFCKNEF